MQAASVVRIVLVAPLNDRREERKDKSSRLNHRHNPQNSIK